MSQREFFNLSIGQIETLCEKHRNNLDMLSRLLEEITYRTGFSATAAQLAITKRVRELEAKQNRKSQEKPNERKTDRPKNDKDSSNIEVSQLRKQLAEAQKKIEDLEIRIKKDTRPEDEKIFHRVGLNQDSPEFVIRAARTAYRKELHPDTRPEKHKTEAHKRFVEVENIFSKIFKLRNL